MPNPVPPPALSLMDMREYRAYAANWALENPGAGSVSVAEWLVFRTWKADNDAVYAAACARTNTTNFEDVLDPRLRLIPAPAPNTMDGPALAPAPAHAPLLPKICVGVGAKRLLVRTRMVRPTMKALTPWKNLLGISAGQTVVARRPRSIARSPRRTSTSQKSRPSSMMNCGYVFVEYMHI